MTFLALHDREFCGNSLGTLWERFGELYRMLWELCRKVLETIWEQRVIYYVFYFDSFIKILLLCCMGASTI